MAAYMAQLELDGVKLVPDKQETLSRLLEVQYSSELLEFAKVYHYRGEFCPVKKGVLTYPDWFPTDKQLEGAGVPISDMLKRAKSQAYEEAKSYWFHQGELMTEKRYEENAEYLRECAGNSEYALTKAKIEMIEGREQALNAKYKQLEEREQALIRREKTIESKQEFYREFKKELEK